MAIIIEVKMHFYYFGNEREKVLMLRMNANLILSKYISKVQVEYAFIDTC